MEYPQHVKLEIIRGDLSVCINYLLLTPVIIIGGLVALECFRECAYVPLFFIIIKPISEISVLFKPEDVSILFQLFILSMCSEYVNNDKISDTQRWEEGR